jgi:hypothetical protein
MKFHYSILILAIALSACAPGNPHATGQNNRLTAAQKTTIGKKIWQNESGGKIDGLTAWNVGEEFPSLGIGHFIWYPVGFNGRFKESWPDFIAYATSKGSNPPTIAKVADSPWNSRAEFFKDFRSPEMVGLRDWLASTINLQTDFIVDRSHAAFPKILSAAPVAERSKIKANYEKVASTAQGTYALIDYINFKGDGTSQTEKYKGQGWGLLQVLGGMQEVVAGPVAAKEFAASAKRILSRRINNSPHERGEARWLEGWHNRCDTYARPLE